MNPFINDAVEYGISNYVKQKYGLPVDQTHMFEYEIIGVLTSIFEEINILNPYKLKDEKNFKENLTQYSIDTKMVDKLLELLNDYTKWLTGTDKSKSERIVIIEKILVEMIMKKSIVKEIEPQELETYDQFFGPNNQYLKKLNELSSINPHEGYDFWNKKEKSYLKPKNIYLEEITPKFLPEKKYEDRGLSKKELEQFSNLKIEEINSKIMEEEQREAGSSSGGRKKSKPLQLVLTSGSGFTDTLVLLSVMTTEIMVGLLIAFTIARG